MTARKRAPKPRTVEGWCIVDLSDETIYGTGLWDTKEDCQQAIDVCSRPDDYTPVRLTGRVPQRRGKK